MTRPRILRLLRIAFSATCGMVCLLVIVMWWASLSTLYSWQGHATATRLLHFQAAYGKAMLFAVPYNGALLAEMGFESSFSNVPLENIEHIDEQSVPVAGTDGDMMYFNNRICIVPFWFLLLAAVGLAAIPWAPWKLTFSLRTLLLTTTLVALALGAIVYAIR